MDIIFTSPLTADFSNGPPCQRNGCARKWDDPKRQTAHGRQRRGLPRCERRREEDQGCAEAGGGRARDQVP